MRAVTGRGPLRSATIAVAICAALAVVFAGLMGYWDDGEAKAQASGGSATEEQTIGKTGHIDSDRPDSVYQPFEVPEGVTTRLSGAPATGRTWPG